MRMKKIVENGTLKSAAAEFLAFKWAQKIRGRTLHDYQKYINPLFAWCAKQDYLPYNPFDKLERKN